MKHTVLIIASFFLLSGPIWAQEKPLIEVEGQSQLKVLPDEASIQVNLTEKAMTTATATEGLNQKAKAITNAMDQSGVKDYKLTANNYYVNVNRIYTKGSAKDSGYVASQTINIVLNETEKDLVKIVEILHQTTEMGFQLQFNLSDEKRNGYEKALLEMALEDAKRKADIIAANMGIKEMKVQKIVYTSGPSFQPVMYHAEARMMKSAEDRTGPTFSPEEQTISDRITVAFSFNP